MLEARDGREAIRLCRGHEEPIDLLVTDVVLPRMDGPTLAARIHTLRPETRVPFISGYQLGEPSWLLEQGLDAGIASNILSQRLKRLEQEALVVAQPYSERPRRFEYELTESSRELAWRPAFALRLGSAPFRRRRADPPFGLRDAARGALVLPDLRTSGDRGRSQRRTFRMMAYRLLAALAALLIAASGCSGDGGPPAKHRDVIKVLRERGLVPERRGSGPADLLDVRSTVYGISGGELHVFSFSSARRAAVAASQVATDGYSIETRGRAVQVEWLAAPHWYRAEDQIVLYLGTNRRVLSTLDAIAGPQFAGS